jgi:hypothetical protein
VVKAGVVTAQNRQNRSSDHLGMEGLFGFSVQHEPGKTIYELAEAGQFPNAQISVTTVEALVAAAASIGYTVQVVRSPGRGFHHTVQVPKPLATDLAAALSGVFVQMPNPARVP